MNTILERLAQLGYDCFASVTLQQGAREAAKAAREQRKLEAAERLQNRLGQRISFNLITPGVRAVHLHIGPTNSGKTHHALEQLKTADRGLYLAPLRLLAWEAADRLNEQGCPTDLVTGEESVEVEGARVIAATTEMFPEGVYDVVVIDEAQMVADPDRGWAWLRAMTQAKAGELHVCAAPQAEPFLRQLFETLGDELTVTWYERLVPLRPHHEAIPLKRLPPRSAVVAFSRQAVLQLKAEIEQVHRKPCAVIYGALPPDVRREQARRVRSGEAPFVVATDAIGMGINFPVDHVFLYDVVKYDGRSERPLRTEEVRQIIGRAGRFGLSEAGWYGALSRENHHALLAIAAEEPAPITHAYLQPSIDQLQMLTGRLAKRLQLWQLLAEPVVPEFIRIAPLEQMIELARLLPPQLEEDLKTAYMLITAPVTRESQAYWKAVVEALVANRRAPAPSGITGQIGSDAELQTAEGALRQHELALWLMRRGVDCRVNERFLRRTREYIADAMNTALARGLTMGGCKLCGRRLPPGYRFRICQACYEASRDIGAPRRDV
ncbi:MAG TPA: helicase-related protein [Symbiobacteriaceae bacterium]|nr:helicase-related protein [Symbiobacteriaceae bacterium]